MMTCRHILSVMVALGFIFNTMLFTNITIAIVDMTNSTNPEHSSSVNVTRFNWSKKIINEILGSFFWGNPLSTIPGGRLAEVIGSKKVFGGSMLLASVLTILTPVTCNTNYRLLLLNRAVTGFMIGIPYPVISTIAAKWIPPLERSKFMSNLVANSLGAALTLPICGLLISYLGWPSVFYVTGALGLVWSILWFLIVHESPAEHPRISKEEREYIEKTIAESVGEKTLKPSKVPWLKIILSPPVWAIVVAHFCYCFGYYTAVNQLPTYMAHVLNFNIKSNGILSSLPYLGKYAMALVSSYLADKLLQSGKISTTLTRKLFTGFALLIPGLLMVTQAIWGYDSTLSVTIFTATYFFNGAFTGGYLTNALDIAPYFSGTIFGIAAFAAGIGGWVSTAIVGSLVEESSTFEQWKYLFWLMAVIYFFGTVVYSIFGSGELQKWNYKKTAVLRAADDCTKIEVVEIKLLDNNKTGDEFQ